MIESISEYTDVLIKENLTPNQYYLIILLATEDNVNLYKYLQKGHMLYAAEIQDLLDRDYLQTADGKLAKDPDLYMVPQEVKDKFIITNVDPGEAFWDFYPSFIFSPTLQRNIPLKGIAKEDFVDFYNKLVNKNLSKHRRIMRALNAAKIHGKATLRIDNWIKSELWKTIEEEYKLMEYDRQQ